MSLSTSPTKHSSLLSTSSSVHVTPPSSPSGDFRRKVSVPPVSSEAINADLPSIKPLDGASTMMESILPSGSPSPQLGPVRTIGLRVLGFFFTPRIFVAMVLLLSLSIAMFCILASLTTQDEDYVCPIGVNLSAVFAGIGAFFISSSALLLLIYHRIETTYVYWKGVAAFYLLMSLTSAAVLSNAAFDECIFKSFVSSLARAIRGWMVTLCIFYWIFGFLLVVLWVMPTVQRFYNKPTTTQPARRKETSPFVIDYVSRYDMGVSIPGAIGLSIAPGRNKKKWERDLNQDLTMIRDTHHIDVVVTLLTDIDLAWLQSSNIGEKVESMGMTWVHFPIRDKWIPSNMLFFISQINIIIDRLREGKRVLIHCNGGKGRTGLLTAAILIVLGDSAPDAIIKVWKTRSGTLLNPLQLVYLHHFALQHKIYRYNIL